MQTRGGCRRTIFVLGLVLLRLLCLNLLASASTSAATATACLFLSGLQSVILVSTPVILRVHLFDKVQIMAPSFLQFDPRRVRSYLFRLPLCTRLLIIVIFAFYIASLTLPWFIQWASLIPSEIGLATRKFAHKLQYTCHG